MRTLRSNAHVSHLNAAQKIRSNTCYMYISCKIAICYALRLAEPSASMSLEKMGEDEHAHHQKNREQSEKDENDIFDTYIRYQDVELADNNKQKEQMKSATSHFGGWNKWINAPAAAGGMTTG